MWTLVVTGPKLDVQQYMLESEGTITIGRADECGIVLPADMVSRLHARVEASRMGLRVSDLGSRNGTRVNEQVVGQFGRTLQPGDVVSIGEYEISIRQAATQQRPLADDFVTLRTSELARNAFSAGDQDTVAGPAATNPTSAAEPSEHGPHLFRLASLLAQRVAPSTFVGEVLACATQVTGFDGAVLLVDETGTLRPVLAPSVENPEAFLWSRTIINAALDRGSVLFARHLPLDPRFNTAQSVVLSRHLHVLVAPLVSGAQLVGAIYLSTHASAPPSQATVDFVAAIAQLASLALEGAPRCAETSRIAQA